jgi:hypothetical protein
MKKEDCSMIFVFAILYVGLIIIAINFKIPVWASIPICVIVPYIFVLWTSQEHPYETLLNFFKNLIQSFKPNTYRIAGVIVKKGVPLNMYPIEDAKTIIEALVIKLDAKQSIRDKKYRIALISTKTGLTGSLNGFDRNTLRDIYIHLTGWYGLKYVYQVRPFSLVGV